MLEEGGNLIAVFIIQSLDEIKGQGYILSTKGCLG